MQITKSGLKVPEIQEINIQSFGDNVKILDDHLNDTDIHINAEKIAKIAETDELTQIDSTDTNSTMWGKIKKSISEVTDHVNKVASETTLGHIKIGTGIQMINDVANVKIANDLTTADKEIALSADMGKFLNESKAPINHASTTTIYGVGNSSNFGHVKLSDNYTSSAGAASGGVGASSKAVSDLYNAMNANLKWKFLGQVDGTNQIVLPQGFKELYVEVSYDLIRYFVDFNIIADTLPENDQKWYFRGTYFNADNNSHIGIHIINKSIIKIGDFRISTSGNVSHPEPGPVEVYTAGTLRVWYR